MNLAYFYNLCINHFCVCFFVKCKGYCPRNCWQKTTLCFFFEDPMKIRPWGHGTNIIKSQLKTHPQILHFQLCWDFAKIVCHQHFWNLFHVSWDLKTILAFLQRCKWPHTQIKLLSIYSLFILPCYNGMIYLYKCSINLRQYSRFKRSLQKKVVHTKLFSIFKKNHPTNMHGTKHTTEFVLILFIFSNWNTF